jgi:hypothetical protein
MAAFTLNCGVRPEQREPIQVSIHIPSDLAPSTHRMTLFAVASQLPAMNIGMTIGALVSYVGKNQISMTLPTGQAGMHSLEGETRIPMIEFRRRLYGFPACRGVALLARNFKSSMGIGSALLSG